MLRRLSRLLIIALLLALLAYAASRLMGGDDDDFDDFDDLDSGFEFQETPVEIDVPAADVPTSDDDSPQQSSQSTSNRSATGPLDDPLGETSSSNGHVEGRLIDINGIGPAYEARLQAIGINSIHDLAHADAESIATKIDVIGGASTVSEWITQARSQHTHDQ